MKYLTRINDYWLSRSEKVRSIVYLFPAFVLFLPGILVDSGRPRKAAIRALTLSVLFLLAAFLIYMVHFYIWKRSYQGRFIRDLFFFLLHLATVIAYLFYSGMLILAESKGNPAPEFWLDRVSRKLVSFLEFKTEPESGTEAAAKSAH